MPRRRGLLPLLVTLLTGACAPRAGHPVAAAGAAPRGEHAHGRMGTHGMVLVGTPGEAYLSHLPMFGAPHDVQVVVTGRLRWDGTRADLPASFSDAPYTFLPAPLSLDALRSGALVEVRGRVFAGNFESGGHPVADAVFTVARVVENRRLDATERPDRLAYVVFGTRRHAFAAHRIAGAPSFDEILDVTLAGDVPTDAALARGVLVTAAHPDVPEHRLGLAPGVALFSEAAAFRVTARRALSCVRGPDFDIPCE